MLYQRRDHLAPRLIEFIEASLAADRAREEAARAAERQRLNRTRLVAAVMAILLGAAIILSYFVYDRSVREKTARQIADQRATELTVALGEARANLIWSRLEFKSLECELQPREVDAVWDLATGGPAVREAFLKQLANNHSLVLKFAQCPDPVLRALGLQLSTEQTHILIDAVIHTLKDTTDPKSLSSLLAIMQQFPVPLTSEQAQAALGSVLDVLMHDPSIFAVRKPLPLFVATCNRKPANLQSTPFSDRNYLQLKGIQTDIICN
jgi:hypothetical protein